MRIVVPLTLLLSLLAGTLRAQTLRGRLVEDGSAAGVVGALVLLQDSSRKRVAEGVSGEAGRFALRAPSAGRYLLRVLRIGYHPFETDVQLGPEEMPSRTFTLSGLPFSLPEITVVGTSVCGARSRGDTLSSALWIEAGTALGITAQTVKSASLRFVVVREGREIDRSGTSYPVDAPNPLGTSGWPVRSPPADTLLVSGFIENIDDKSVGPTWYGPDAEFLLSEPFFDGHCFHVIPPTDSIPATWVGLAFEPATADRRADIRGTLWMDRQSAELRRLEFTYTRLPRWARGADAGGRLDFAPLPGGGWIVQRWLLRVPIPERTPNGAMRIYGYRELGGHVRAVRDAQGKVLQTYAH